jgi:hypothetical protein
MKRILLVYLVILTSTAVFAQSKFSSSRFQKQHMTQTIEMLTDALQSNNPTMQTSGAQAIRQLEYIYPDEPFTEFIQPLSEVVKDDNADVHARILSAIALEGLHTDIGDKVLEETSKSTSNESVRELCSALLVKVRE